MTQATPISSERSPKSSTAEVMTGGRLDLYRFPHRGLRAAMAEALLDVGTASATPESLDAIANTIESLAFLCKTHLEHENRFVHPAMEQRTPGSARGTADDHVGHERAIERLGIMVAELRSRPGPAEARRLLDQLYRMLALFVADNLEHMDLEERHNMRVLWAAYTDAELQQLEQELVASIAPDAMLAFMRWMLPAVSAEERCEFLEQMSLGAPPHVVRAVIDAAAPHLAAGEAETLVLRFAPPEMS